MEEVTPSKEKIQHPGKWVDLEKNVNIGMGSDTSTGVNDV
jgi:hypothetical protein